MNKKDHFFQNHNNFLLDDDFIKWRLFQTKDSEDYWTDFRLKNPHLEKSIQEAISQFDAVKINRYLFSENERKEIYRDVLRNINKQKRRRLILKMGTAAAVLVITALTALFITQMRNNAGADIPIKNDMIVGNTLPEEDIYLITGNKKIELTQNSHIGLTKEGKATITDSTHSKKELLLAKTEMNSLFVPYGKRTNLTLSDGTEVWLNSGTQLDFPSEFMGKTREIRVDGEIYIDVAHNPSCPFIVHAQGTEVIVQGTSFNISAYRDDLKKTIVLVAGKVKIKRGDKHIADLLPNEKIDITENNILKETVDVSEYITWKKGVLEFNSTPMAEILKKIGRYYNVQFENTADVKLNEQTFSGKLFLSNNLDSVMTSVSILSATNYQREKKKIHITKNKMPMSK
jgi:hypothetical protein